MGIHHNEQKSNRPLPLRWAAMATRMEEMWIHASMADQTKAYPTTDALRLWLSWTVRCDGMPRLFEGF